MYINNKFNNSESTNIIHFLWIGYASTPNMLNKSEILQTTGKNKKKKQFTQMWIFYQGNRKPTFKGRQNQPVRFNVHQKEKTAAMFSWC